jgi:DNA-3-methyladenine glycosylase I
MPDGKPRCAWPGEDAAMRDYHDREWGVPVNDDVQWLEYIILDGFQAGLSWKTILHKREAFRRVFHQFDPQRVARMSEAETAAAAVNPGIVRNRMKIAAAVRNAGRFLDLTERHGSFSRFIWAFTGGKVVHNAWTSMADIPARTSLSDTVSTALKQAGFTFVGSTICYAVLQSGGIVNDHLVSCYRHDQLRRSSP